MIDFLRIATKSTKRGVVEIYPKFIINNHSKDLMIRGGDFYAIWIEERKLWSTDEQDVIMLVDRELDNFANEHKNDFDGMVRVLHMWDSESGVIDDWHKYCQRQMRDNFHILDENIIFGNTETKKEDYASKTLPYPLQECDITGYETLMSTLYSPEERHKLEWAIGSIVVGDSKHIQKFIVLYGSAGTGKSTILNIIQMLFDGYYSVFDAKALGSASNVFALEAFKSNPLVAIQHDGDLSRIEDNTRLNSLVSHELMTVNEKFKSTYANRFRCFLFMGTNRPVKITDSKSGLMRRLIDVSPTGNKLSYKDYNKAFKRISFELPGIAYHCKEVYLSDPDYYDNYIPTNMMSASNDFYNFMLDAYFVFKDDDATTLNQAWDLYGRYCEEAKVPYPYTKRLFKEELKNYFEEYHDRCTLDDGTRVRSYFKKFKEMKFNRDVTDIESKPYEIIFNGTESAFDILCSECPAQYATDDGIPQYKWDRVKTRLKDIDTSRLHYVRVPENHIVIDFDLKDENGNKCLERNLEEANKFPPTYSEVSKSGCAIHLHYIYEGDVKQLNNLYAPDIEIKVSTGKGALRRQLTKFNDLPINTIGSGLPLKKKGEQKMVNADRIKSEKGIRRMIVRNLKKEIHPGTKPSIEFIKTILDKSYSDGIEYDVTDMYNDIMIFAANSTHHPEYCLKLLNEMKLKSESYSDEDGVDTYEEDCPYVFYDVEVFPNLFIVCYKKAGKDMPISRMINPDPERLAQFINGKHKLIGFNCRRYDNHIIYARAFLDYSLEQLYDLSQTIISGGSNCFFREAYGLSYTDIYDFSSKKQSLKKFEIELGIHHKELGLPWDQPVPEELWMRVSEYCDNDVIATEAVFNARQADFKARLILADLADMTPNSTTNSLTTKIIFEGEKNPQHEFNYRDMSKPIKNLERDNRETYKFLNEFFPSMIFEWACSGESDLPYFNGYTYEGGKSIYHDCLIGEGGNVYAEPGMYKNVALLDVASMHPHSILAECLFGPYYTMNFKNIVDARIHIKHKEFDKVRNMFGGKLSKYLTDEKAAKDLSQALKIAINSVYGLTAAKFDNPFRDIRNKDNIVAKRGALFMEDLKLKMQERGCTVAHIKTDSIKIPNATEEDIKFVMDFGSYYGYTFEHEATYERMCLINDAVYIAHMEDGSWSATGKEFQVPYVFKTLFSHEPIEFSDLCETRSVATALYLDMNENLPEDEHDYHFVGKVGLFCPMLPGAGGGLLLREKDGKYYAVGGTKGYRWMESEMVKALHLEDKIDISYYETLASEAIKDIEAFGNFKEFTEV